MKISAKCYACAYCQQCNKEQEEKCRNLGYILFTTETQKLMCDLMGCNDEVNNNDME